MTEERRLEMAKKQSMTERVLNELRNDIINWNYNENDMITEAEISQKFGVSKTPSREALNYLCMEGFLEKIPNKGYLVKGHFRHGTAESVSVQRHLGKGLCGNGDPVCNSR